MQTYTDETILKTLTKSIEGRDQMIAWLYKDDAFRNKAFGVIRKMVHKSLDDQNSILFDIFEDSLLKFVDLVCRGKFERKSSVHTFIIGICKFKCMEYNRQFKRNTQEVLQLVGEAGETIDILSEVENPEDQFVKMESGLETIVKQVIEQLSEKCQEVLRRYLFEEQTVKFMATAMNTTEQTIKNARSKCRKQLQELLKQHPETPRFIKKMA